LADSDDCALLWGVGWDLQDAGVERLYVHRDLVALDGKQRLANRHCVAILF
jgi:hypothetical protein